MKARARMLVASMIVLLAACDPTPTPPPTATTLAPSSSPASVASPEPAGTPHASDAPQTTGGQPTAADLIERDRLAGKIDDPTALLYRVYAVFGDPRLPEAYRAGLPSEDGAAFALVHEQLDGLPSLIAQEVRPFLVRPTDPSSVFHDIRGASAAAPNRTATLASYVSRQAGSPRLAAPAAVACNPITGWGYARGQANFKVWGECGTPQVDAEIQLLVAMTDVLWDAEKAFMGLDVVPDEGAPTPDEWLNDQGGDQRIDIYMVNPCVSRGGQCRAPGPKALAVAMDCPKYTTLKGVGISSAYILIPRAAIADPLALESTLAHELFHAFQGSMNLKGTLENGDWHWFVEASAKWAEWHFVPRTAATEVAPWFSDFQTSNDPLYSTDDTNEYASFAWPLFMEQAAGGPNVIAQTWQAIEGKRNHDGVTQAIDGQLHFRENFRRFAVRTWNESLGAGEPLEPLLPERPTGAGRPEPGGGHRWRDANLVATPPGAQPLRGAESIRGLYARYVRFNVADDVGKVILDLSGLSPRDAFDGDVLLKIRDKGWEHRKLKKGKTTWCMDNPDDDIEQFVVVLANHDKARGIVQGAWTVESPLEPCLSYEIKITWTDVFNGIADTFAFDGFADTIDPNTSGNGVTTLTGTGTLSGSRPGWKSCNPGIDVVPSGNGAAEFVASIAGDQVSIGAFPALASADFGVSTQPFTLDRKGGPLTIKSRPGNVGGDLCPQSWTGRITATLKLREPLGNAEGP